MGHGPSPCWEIELIKFSKTSFLHFKTYFIQIGHCYLYTAIYTQLQKRCHRKMKKKEKAKQELIRLIQPHSHGGFICSRYISPLEFSALLSFSFKTIANSNRQIRRPGADAANEFIRLIRLVLNSYLAFFIFLRQHYCNQVKINLIPITLLSSMFSFQNAWPIKRKAVYRYILVPVLFHIFIRFLVACENWIRSQLVYFLQVLLQFQYAFRPLLQAVHVNFTSYLQLSGVWSQ